VLSYNNISLSFNSAPQLEQCLGWRKNIRLKLVLPQVSQNLMLRRLKKEINVITGKAISQLKRFTPATRVKAENKTPDRIMYRRKYFFLNFTLLFKKNKKKPVIPRAIHTKTSIHKEKRSMGRPKGSKNKKNEKPRLSPELLRIQPVLQAFLAILKGVLAVQYLVMDGHFGNYPSAWMVLQTGLQFVSKLRSDAALYEPFAGKYCGRGARPKYGDKVDVRKMKRKYLKSDKKEDGVRLAMADAIHLVFVIAFVSAALGLAAVFFTPHQELKEKSPESSPPLVSMD
jgi:hypothetical protein